MARTGRGWDAKPPAPGRRGGQAQSRQAAPEAADDGPVVQPRRSLPWSNRPAEQTSREPWSNRPGAEQPSDEPRSLPWSDQPGADQADDERPADFDEAFRSSRPGRGEGGRGLGGSKRGSRSRNGLGASKGGSRSREPADAVDEPERDPHELARDICLKLLAARPRTRAELATALRKRHVAKEAADAVLNRYSEVGMIDDAAFAKAWVTTRHHGRGLAGRALAQELRQKGVDQEHVTEALSELDPDTEMRTALELAMRKLRTTRGEPDAVFRRILGALARKGYSGGVAVRAVKEALATRDAELSELIDPDVYEE